MFFVISCQILTAQNALEPPGQIRTRNLVNYATKPHFWPTIVNAVGWHAFAALAANALVVPTLKGRESMAPNGVNDPTVFVDATS